MMIYFFIYSQFAENERIRVLEERQLSNLDRGVTQLRYLQTKFKQVSELCYACAARTAWNS